MQLNALIPIIIAYLIGSISFSYLIGRIIKGIDIRQHGSGNAGATNTYRVLGKWTGLTVLLLDVFKAIFAVWIAQQSSDEIGVHALAGLAVVCGHNWPIFFKFKGGKGVASTIGAMAILSFWPTLIAVTLTIVTIAISRYVSLGSLVMASILPFIVWIYDQPIELICLSLIIGVLSFYQHRKNIGKLLRGEENPIFKKKIQG
jgi:glycerol-3-phosphate acyltransferase PlsY